MKEDVIDKCLRIFTKKCNFVFILSNYDDFSLWSINCTYCGSRTRLNSRSTVCHYSTALSLYHNGTFHCPNRKPVLHLQMIPQLFIICYEIWILACHQKNKTNISPHFQLFNEINTNQNYQNDELNFKTSMSCQDTGLQILKKFK